MPVGRIDSVEAAWYYGSVARAEDRPDSDLDIAIVASGTQFSTSIRAFVLQARNASNNRSVIIITCVIVGREP
jgi:predicted nucleotidyltransferase